MDMSIFPNHLLSIDTNAKTIKGQEFGFMTGILYLAPSDVSGFQVCPMAKLAGCEAACLNTAGKGAMSHVQQARIRKTQLFFNKRIEFMARLVRDVNWLVRKAEKYNKTPLVRLNGTSDIRWENVPVEVNGIDYPNIMQAFPNVQFYDYTKLPNRKKLPRNYDLTFSHSGIATWQPYYKEAKRNNMRIAVVFRKEADIPETFDGLMCIGGDNSDVRHTEPQGVVVALYAKGKARKDTSGFVFDKPVIMIKSV